MSVADSKRLRRHLFIEMINNMCRHAPHTGIQWVKRTTCAPAPMTWPSDMGAIVADGRVVIVSLGGIVLLTTAPITAGAGIGWGATLRQGRRYEWNR